MMDRLYLSAGYLVSLVALTLFAATAIDQAYGLTVAPAKESHQVEADQSWQGNLPPVRHQGQVDYMTGGFTVDESKAMQRSAGRFALELLFVERSLSRDGYTANVNVTISDAQGRSILETVSTGPYLFVDLPTGTYTVKVTLNGHTQTRLLKVRRGDPQRQIFVWSGAVD